MLGHKNSRVNLRPSSRRARASPAPMNLPNPVPELSIDTCLRRDQHRLRRERDRLRAEKLRGNDVAAAEAALAQKIAASTAARAARAASVPQAQLSGRAADLGESRRDPPRDREASGRHPLRRDGLGQDDAAAQDLPRGGAWRRGRHRPHAAAAHRRARGGVAHRGGTEHAARASSWATSCASRIAAGRKG